MSSEQDRFIRWLVAKYLHIEGTVEDSVEEFWHAHKKALMKQGITKAEVLDFVTHHVRGA